MLPSQARPTSRHSCTYSVSSSVVTGLDQTVFPEEVRRDLETIVNYHKTADVLFGNWGFGLHHGNTRGVSALFYGAPGEWSRSIQVGGPGDGLEVMAESIV
jgi:hypothetical protein